MTQHGVHPRRSRVDTLCIMQRSFVVIGGGPAGNTAASRAATLGAQVTLIERDVVGGAAHLWDCIPSKAMIATGGELSELRRAQTMGLDANGKLDVTALRHRLVGIQAHLQQSVTTLLESQNVRLLHGSAQVKGVHKVVAQTDDGVEEITADAVLVATGSRPRIPSWAQVDGERILTTRDAYPPKEIPEHLIIIGSGVTGVEFTHMFSVLGSAVTLVVSRQQVLPLKDPEVAAVLEDEFLARGVGLLKGAKAKNITRNGDEVIVECDDGRLVKGSHALLAIGSIPNSGDLGLEEVGVEINEAGFIPINRNCQTNVEYFYAAGDVSGRLPLSSVGALQGRKAAEHALGFSDLDTRHIDYDKAASAIFTEPEIADVGLAEADAYSAGRKIRVTKVPFAANAKALIVGDPRGFVKIISDPNTDVVLGGSIVGRNAAEMIAVLALAVTNSLKIHDIMDTLFVHPTMVESLSDAAS